MLMRPTNLPRLMIALGAAMAGAGLLPLSLAGQPGAADTVLLPEVESIPETARRIRTEWEFEAIDSAIEFGLFSVADRLLGRVLQSGPGEAALPGLLNQRLQVSLVLGDVETATAILSRLEESGLEADPLLRAVYRYRTGDDAAARRILGGIPLSSLEREPLAWYYLMNALLLSREGDSETANEYFQLAEAAAPTPLLLEHFEILRLKEELRGGLVSDDSISALRESVRSMQGERGGFEAARLLAIALHQSGQADEAIELLSRQLAMPGLREFGLRPDFLLLLGVVAGPDSSRGKLSLRQLVGEGEGGDSLSIALSLLARTATSPESRKAFLENLSTWLAADPPHPLTDRLLAYRAHLLVNENQLAEAMASAQRLITEFPGSAFVPQTLKVLAYISWSQDPPRYRTAADYLNRLRQQQPDGREALETGVLIADCFFLNGDYTSASDAYGAVFAQAGPEWASRVLYQMVLSEIAAGRPGDAARLLDEAYRDDRIDVIALWRSEWNLLDHLRREQDPGVALRRLNALLSRDPPEAAIPEQLVLRMEWLQARLTLESGRALPAIESAAVLIGDLDSPRFSTLDPALLAEVESHLLLLIGEGHYNLGQAAEGLETFITLRERFPDSGPAILSYLVESRSEFGQDNLVSAQQSLIGLVDRFPDSEFAPIALWEAALNAEQRGLAAHLQEAITILERLVTDYPAHSLVYYARLKQGDIARRLNDFPTALLLYERLLARFPDHPERYRAEMDRADCLMALASEDEARYDLAAAVYERICLLPGTPLPVRIEAGYKWAHASRREGDLEGGMSVLWLLHDRFVLDEEMRRPAIGDPAGRYWLSRILLDLGKWQEENGEFADAIRVYKWLIELNLPGSVLAEAKLAALR